MRLRHKKWASSMIENHQDVVMDFEKLEEGTSLKPNVLEIGSGCGQFLIEIARKNPDLFFLGVEINRDAFAIGIKKYSAILDAPSNLCYMNADINKVLPYIKDGQLERIYLNFNDPWPKKKHNKRRLTYPTRLSEYYRLLKSGGMLLIKTDNQGYFEDTVTYLEGIGLFKTFYDRDYQTKDDDVTSEYEARFRALGKTIYRIVGTKCD